MNEENVIEVKETPDFNEMFGCVSKPIDFTPTEMFDVFNIPDEDHYSFKMKPLTDKQKSMINNIQRAVSIEAFKWASEQGINMKKLNDPTKFMDEDGNPTALYYEHEQFMLKFASLSNSEAKYSIMQECVVGCNNYSYRNHETNKLTKMKYKKQPNTDHINNDIWSTVPVKVKAKMYDELMNLSSLTEYEFLNL